MLTACPPPPPGSEVKTMLSKLKGQLEEMRAKVQFLGLAKKYLQARPRPRPEAPPAKPPEYARLRAAAPAQARSERAAGQADSADSRPRSCTRSSGAWSPARCP